MSGLAGFAAGLAEGFAGGRRLKSDLETEKTRREALGLQMENQRLQNEEIRERRDSTTALGNLEKGWASGEGFRPEGADDTYDHRTDPAAISKYYESLRGAMRRQAAAFGRSPTEADKAVDELVKSKYQEKVGQAITLMKSNPAAAIPAIRSVYAGFRDGNEMTGGTYDKATDSFVFNGKDKDGNEIALPPMARKDAIEALSYGALNGADAAKLLISSFEADKRSAAEDKRLGLKIESSEKIAREQNMSQEKIGQARNSTTLQATSIDANAKIQAANINANASGRASADANAERLLEQRQRSLREGYGALINRQLDSLKADRNWTYKTEAERQQAIQNLERDFLPSRAVGEANVRFGAPADADLIHKVFSDSRNPKYMGFVMGENGGVKVKKDPVTGQFYGLTQSGVYVPAPTGMKFQ